MAPYRVAVQLGCPSPQLEDGAVGLRPWTLHDLDCVAEASTHPRIPAGTTVPAIFTPTPGRAFIERQWSHLERGEGISMAIHSRYDDRAVGPIVMMLRPQPARNRSWSREPALEDAAGRNCRR